MDLFPALSRLSTGTELEIAANSVHANHFSAVAQPQPTVQDSVGRPDENRHEWNERRECTHQSCRVHINRVVPRNVGIALRGNIRIGQACTITGLHSITAQPDTRHCETLAIDPPATQASACQQTGERSLSPSFHLNSFLIVCGHSH